MKKLDFTGPEAARTFDLIYDGILGTSRGFTAPSETRVIGSALSKLEAIGHAVKRGDIPTYGLNPKGGVVLLEEAEFNLAREALTQARFTPFVAREATHAVDWFDAAPSQKS